MTTPSSSAWPDLAGRLVKRDGRTTHVLPIRVYFEDTDFSGLVYHASYVRWCERGRSDFLRLLGSEHRALMEPSANRQPKGGDSPVAGGQPKGHDESPVAGGQPKGQTESPAAFVVRRLSLEYLKPARIDDVVEVTTRLIEATAATLRLGQTVSRGPEAICEAEVTVVLVSKDGRVLRLPKALRQRLVPGRAGGA